MIYDKNHVRQSSQSFGRCFISKHGSRTVARDRSSSNDSRKDAEACRVGTQTESGRSGQRPDSGMDVPHTRTLKFSSRWRFPRHRIMTATSDRTIQRCGLSRRVSVCSHEGGVLIMEMPTSAGAALRNWNSCHRHWFNGKCCQC